MWNLHAVCTILDPQTLSSREDSLPYLSLAAPPLPLPEPHQVFLLSRRPASKRPRRGTRSANNYTSDDNDNNGSNETDNDSNSPGLWPVGVLDVCLNCLCSFVLLCAPFCSLLLACARLYSFSLVCVRLCLYSCVVVTVRLCRFVLVCARYCSIVLACARVCSDVLV